MGASVGGLLLPLLLISMDITIAIPQTVMHCGEKGLAFANGIGIGIDIGIARLALALAVYALT